MKAEMGDGQGGYTGVVVNAQVRIMLMCVRNRLGEEVDRGNSFEDKVLTNLTRWGQGYGNPVMRKVTFICGPRLDFQKTIGEYILQGKEQVSQYYMQAKLMLKKGQSFGSQQSCL